MPQLDLSFDSGEDSLSVRRFSVTEGLSELFVVEVEAMSPKADLDLSALVGRAAALSVIHGTAHVADLGARVWRGVVERMAQVAVETTGLSTYAIRIVPAIALLGYAQQTRIFQHRSIPEIVKEILGAWQIPAAWRVNDAGHPRLEIRVQYEETDLSFVRRLLEETGIAFTFEHDEDEAHAITFSDRFHADPPRPPIPYVDNPGQAAEREFVGPLNLESQVRPGAARARDFDLRRPDTVLLAEAEIADPARATEKKLEHYAMLPGQLFTEDPPGGPEPFGDRLGTSRPNLPFATSLFERHLAAARTGARASVWRTNVVGLRPGTVFEVESHPSGALEGTPLLVTDLRVVGSPGEAWTIEGRAVPAGAPFHPPRNTRKPRVEGVHLGRVVGPRGEEIHTDEHGRVRVRFAWDRLGSEDDRASCWLRVGHGWAGAGLGLHLLPRVGHEVLVQFVGGDPDVPVVIGSAYNSGAPQPFALPADKTWSALQSRSTPSGEGENEVAFQDLRGQEILYLQAERDLKEEVGRNEVGTIDRRRSSLVKGDLAETTGWDLVRVTGGDRSSHVNEDAGRRVEKRLFEQREQRVETLVAGEVRDEVRGDGDRTLHANRRLHVRESWSVQVDGDRHDVTLGRRAAEVKGEIHVLGKDDVVFEGARSVTLKAPGGFIHIGSGGVTIKGTLVKINSGGVAGQGDGSAPEPPKLPGEMARFDPPMDPGEAAPEGGERTRVKEAPPPKAEADAAAPAEVAWIEIHLVDELGEPFSGEPYRVITPDGRRREGTLDADGRAREEGLLPGTCQVTFPRLHRTTWKKA